jgi:hypothetical protein
VKPRSRSRFETETPNFAIPFDQSDADEPGEEYLSSRERVAHIPEHHLPDAKDMPTKPLQIEVQEDRPVDQPISLNPDDDNSDHKPLMQPAPDISPVEKIYEQNIKPLIDTPVRDKREEAPAGPAPVDRMTIVERFKTPMAEPKHRLDGKLDPKISAMLDRIENLRSIVPAPQEEFYTSRRVPSVGDAHAGDALDEPTYQSRQQASMDDGAERANGPNTNGPMQPENAADHRDRPHNALLAPPSWFSEMQVQSMLPGNRPNNQPPPEPVINVTIGRIEVKATKMQETPRVRQQQKPSGVMSLEKYLRQSERGGR